MNNTADLTDSDVKISIWGMRETYAALGAQMTVPSNGRTMSFSVSEEHRTTPAQKISSKKKAKPKKSKTNPASDESS